MRPIRQIRPIRLQRPLGHFGLTAIVWLVSLTGLGTGQEPMREHMKPVNGIRDYGLKAYVRTSERLPHVENRPWKLVCKIPINCQFQPWIEVSGPAGAEIKFNSTNPLVLYLTPTETWTTSAAGVSTYEARNWVSGEGAVYTIPAGVTVKAVKYRETGYDTAFAGSFECNDEDYNILWRRAARTVYLCMRDHFYDCPDRERVGFWGDGTPELDTCFYAFDSRSHRLCKELALRKLEPSFYPGQHLEFLGESGLWFYYMQTGDLATIARVYGSTKEFLLSTYKCGDRNTWFDWGVDNKDTSVLEECFLYGDLGALRKMAITTGHEADLPAIDERREEIRRTFDSRFWKGSCYQSSDVPRPDDRANAMAVNVGLAGPAKWDAIYEHVLSKTPCSSCFFDRWVFEALFKMGRADAALLRMQSRYRTMIESSFTTLWEHYDRWWASWLNAFDEGSSLNHGWNPPALTLSKDVAGIQPIEPGWKIFEVLPDEAFLKRIDVVVPTVKGLVKVKLRKTATRYSIGVVVPAGTEAVVGIRRGAFTRLQKVSLNGVAAWDGSFRGSLPAGASSVASPGDGDGAIKFKVGPGEWELVGHGTVRQDSQKPPRPKPERRVALDTHGWEATASVPDGTFDFSGAKIPIDVSARNAIDGDAWTGWRDMTRTQVPGQWFQVDMKRKRRFDEIELDNTWALYDSPHSYEVTVSDDGVRWGQPIASGRGRLGITRIACPGTSARWIRITQTGSDPTYHWSIYEFAVFTRE